MNKCANCFHFGKHEFPVADVKAFFPNETGEICTKMNLGDFWFPPENFTGCDKFEHKDKK
jgi:hypothetical protein